MKDPTKPRNLEIPTVPCKYCGQPTMMLGTELCDNCWELDKRIGKDTNLARKILEQYERNKQ